MPGYEARIVDEQGRELGADEIGELIVRGPSAGEGYWNQRAKSRRTFAGEWTYTGDKFRRDADGYYYYCGRTDDMFKVSGMWVSPFDVEAALTSHEAVLEAAVIGKEDADGLIKPKAFIVLKNGYAADDSLFEKLKLHVKETAGAWKYPRWIECARPAAHRDRQDPALQAARRGYAGGALNAPQCAGAVVRLQRAEQIGRALHRHALMIEAASRRGRQARRHCRRGRDRRDGIAA